MRAKVYVVVTYHGGHGDDIHVFGRRAPAVACVREYAKDYWDTKRLGRFPRSYTRLCEAWDEHDLWGSTDSRWELEERRSRPTESGSGDVRRKATFCVVTTSRRWVTS